MPADLVLPPPTLRLRVDVSAIADNWRTLEVMSGSAHAAAAVKADAYGVGVARAVPALRDAGCRNFYVAHWREVPVVVALIDPVQVGVLHGPLSATDCNYARMVGVKPVLNSLSQVRLWRECGDGICDLMIDTGMNRLGLRPDEIGDPLLAGLQVDVLMSHLACADEDSAANARQRDLFASIIGHIPHRRASLANSAGIALGSDYTFDLTRPGLALYGGIPRGEMAGRIRQVVTPEATLIQVRNVPAGEAIGYGGTFMAPRDMRIGIVSLGYADGFLRCWSGGVGAFRHGGAMLPVLGRVSMDMAAIDLSAAPKLREGDWVDAEYELEAAAAKTGLTQYELLTVLGPRIRG